MATGVVIILAAVKAERIRRCLPQTCCPRHPDDSTGYEVCGSLGDLFRLERTGTLAYPIAGWAVGCSGGLPLYDARFF